MDWTFYTKSVPKYRPQTRSFISNLLMSNTLETEKFVTDVNIRYVVAFGISFACACLLMCYHHFQFYYEPCQAYDSVNNGIRKTAE